MGGVEMSTAAEGHLDLWLAWKRVNEVVRARILADVVAASALTEAEFTLLAYLDEADGVMRQNALAAAAGWDRTRLSHLLTRMEQRSFVAREKLRNGVQVTMSDPGRQAFAATRAPLIAAVERSFASKLTATQLAALREITSQLAG